MKVRELIEELRKYPPSAPVYGTWEGVVVEVKSVTAPDPKARKYYFGSEMAERDGSAWDGTDGPGPILDVDGG